MHWAGFACSRSPNEDCYMLQKMVRCAFGTNNVDNCARVCHSATVAGLAMTLGSGAMTNPISDITNDVDVIMLVGSNPEEAHPVIGMQIRQAVERGTPADRGRSQRYRSVQTGRYSSEIKARYERRICQRYDECDHQ